MGPHPEFLQSYERARDIRANAAFAEQQLEIADNVSDDWSFNPDSGKLLVRKEAMLRSKIRIETRQWQMARRHPQEWGDRQQIEVRNDWALLSEDERRRRAEELIAMIQEIKTRPKHRRPSSIVLKSPQKTTTNSSGGSAGNLDGLRGRTAEGAHSRL